MCSAAVEKTLNHYYKPSAASSKANQNSPTKNQTSPSKAHPLSIMTNSNRQAGRSLDGSGDLSPERTGTIKQRQSSKTKGFTGSGRSNDTKHQASAEGGKRDDK